MRTSLDDELLDHQKILNAGLEIGIQRGGVGIALGLYTAGLIYANKHLTDGFVPNSWLLTAPHAKPDPMKAAKALVNARLWEEVEGGHRIHDFHPRNPRAEDVRKKRESDKARKAAGQRPR